MYLLAEWLSWYWKVDHCPHYHPQIEKNRLGASFFFTKGGGDVGHAGKFVTTLLCSLRIVYLLSIGIFVQLQLSVEMLHASLSRTNSTSSSSVHYRS